MMLKVTTYGPEFLQAVKWNDLSEFKIMSFDCITIVITIMSKVSTYKKKTVDLDRSSK